MTSHDNGNIVSCIEHNHTQTDQGNIREEIHYTTMTILPTAFTQILGTDDVDNTLFSCLKRLINCLTYTTDYTVTDYTLMTMYFYSFGPFFSVEFEVSPCDGINNSILIQIVWRCVARINIVMNTV